MDRKIPMELKEKQKAMRKETQEKVQVAINTLRSLGYENISISILVKETKLVRSTFQKDHVVEILRDNEVGKYKKISSINKCTLNDEKNSIMLEKELIKANEKIQRLQQEKEVLAQKLTKAKLDLIDANEKQKETVGKFQALYERTVAMGLKIII